MTSLTQSTLLEYDTALWSLMNAIDIEVKLASARQYEVIELRFLLEEVFNSTHLARVIWVDSDGLDTESTIVYQPRDAVKRQCPDLVRAAQKFGVALLNLSVEIISVGYNSMDSDQLDNIKEHTRLHSQLWTQASRCMIQGAAGEDVHWDLTLAKSLRQLRPLV